MLFFHSVENLIIPTDELIFFRGVGIPPARIVVDIVVLKPQFLTVRMLGAND